MCVCVCVFKIQYSFSVANKSVHCVYTARVHCVYTARDDVMIKSVIKKLGFSKVSGINHR